jgi:hypothetical protein
VIDEEGLLSSAWHYKARFGFRWGCVSPVKPCKPTSYMKGRKMLEFLCVLIGFVGTYAGLYYLFNKKDGGVG